MRLVCRFRSKTGLFYGAVFIAIAEEDVGLVDSECERRQEAVTSDADIAQSVLVIVHHRYWKIERVLSNVGAENRRAATIFESPANDIVTFYRKYCFDRNPFNPTPRRSCV